MSPGTTEPDATDVFGRDATPEDDFSIIRNGMLRDPEIPWEVKGIVGNLLSHKPGFPITLDLLLSQSSSGKDSTQRALESARKAGYAYRGERVRYPQGTKNKNGKDISGALGPYQWSFTTDPDKIAKLRAKYAAEADEPDYSGNPAQVPTRDNTGKFTTAGFPQQSEPDAGSPHKSSPAQTGVSAGQHKRGNTTGSDSADLRRRGEKTNRKKTSTPPAPQDADAAGSRSAPDRNEGEGKSGGLMSMADALGKPEQAPLEPSREKSGSAQVVPSTADGEFVRGGEIVSQRGYDALEMVDLWSNTLTDPAHIRGRLRNDLIKGVREVLAESPGADDWHIKEALDEYLRNGRSPKYLPMAFREVQRKAARQANGLDMTDRQKLQAEHYRGELDRMSQAGPGSLSAGAAQVRDLRAAYAAASMSNVQADKQRPDWCTTCDPDNRGWLPREVNDKGVEVGPARKCPECTPAPRGIDYGAAKAEARAFYRSKFGEFYGPGDDGVFDGELVD